jgi:hypothetical protein
MIVLVHFQASMLYCYKGCLRETKGFEQKTEKISLTQKWRTHRWQTHSEVQDSPSSSCKDNERDEGAVQSSNSTVVYSPINSKKAKVIRDLTGHTLREYQGIMTSPQDVLFFSLEMTSWEKEVKRPTTVNPVIEWRLRVIRRARTPTKTTGMSNQIPVNTFFPGDSLRTGKGECLSCIWEIPRRTILNNELFNRNDFLACETDTVQYVRRCQGNEREWQWRRDGDSDTEKKGVKTAVLFENKNLWEEQDNSCSSFSLLSRLESSIFLPLSLR